MEPATIAKANTEHAHQAAFFCWLAEQSQRDPRLAFFFAVPNGGERDVRVASRLKAEGVKQGVPDTLLPIPSKGYHGLWIEFKRPQTEKHAKGRTSKDQDKWIAFLQSQNYSVIICDNWLQAANAVLSYLY